MILFKKLAGEEVLKILLDHAINALPEDSKGILEAKFVENDSVEIYFVGLDDNENNNN